MAAAQLLEYDHSVVVVAVFLDVTATRDRHYDIALARLASLTVVVADDEVLGLDGLHAARIRRGREKLLQQLVHGRVPTATVGCGYSQSLLANVATVAEIVARWVLVGCRDEHGWEPLASVDALERILLLSPTSFLFIERYTLMAAGVILLFLTRSLPNDIKSINDSVHSYSYAYPSIWLVQLEHRVLHIGGKQEFLVAPAPATVIVGVDGGDIATQEVIGTILSLNAVDVMVMVELLHVIVVEGGLLAVLLRLDHRHQILSSYVLLMLEVKDISIELMVVICSCRVLLLELVLILMTGTASTAL